MHLFENINKSLPEKNHIESRHTKRFFKCLVVKNAKFLVMAKYLNDNIQYFETPFIDI